ncbi:hypothetical protein JKF63_02297 [Porcisia hertigi]|uniref:CCHC-type domain-containing protein n=1 Tax=Porcisia hertigi TaxID=2761500 RepID=A0A836HZ88_9TRYP|nr:hypothetical protein JKF63_02297 [Porcisia hertigi]
MASRIPLPLRLVQCDLWAARASGSLGSDHNHANSQVLTVYKPSGLPCFATSQVNAVASAGGDGRRLCAIHTRYTSDTSSSATIVEAGPQPHPEDPNDSLLTRIVDAALPGCAPYVALPVVSSLLRRGGPGTAPAPQLNQWTSRCKGLVMVTRTPSDALFLRNAAQLDLVRQTYRVVCRLPPGVASAARQFLRTHNNLTNLRQAGDDALKGRGILNPYVQMHMERRRRDEQLFDLTVGIPLSAEPLAAPGSTNETVMSTFARDSRLPASVHPHPLVTGGFFDVARSQLRVQGTVGCYLRTQAPLTAASAARVHQRARLQNLFAAQPALAADHNSGTSTFNEHLHDSRHPWIPPSWRLGVSLDAPHMHCDVAAAGGHNAHLGDRASVPAPRGKSLSMKTRLVSLSPHDNSDVALYEVQTHGDTTADEVAAVFHAEGLTVVNDYVQDVSLAMAIEEVANRMRAAPPGLLHELPLGLQHRLRSATAEELVALPLTRIPLEDADRLAVHNNLAHLSSLPPSLPFEEDVERLRQVVVGAASPNSGNVRFPLQRLLLHALSSLKWTNEAERRVYQQVLALALGTGVECTGVVFPDPSDARNVHALQQIWLTYQQQRQRHPSLADAARAARQHPLASSLRYCTRSILDDPAGLTRVPLLGDVAMSTATGVAAESITAYSGHGDAPSARGECSFTQAVELLSPFSHPQLVDSRRRSLTDESHDSTAGALTNFNALTTQWGQTEVPPPYQAAFHDWCAASASPACFFTDTASPGRGALSLLPSPQRLLEHCNVPSSSREHESEPLAERPRSSRGSSAPSLAHVRPPVRVFLRVEELAELRCAYCGGLGHSWQHCVTRVAETVTPLEEDGDVTKCIPPREGDVKTSGPLSDSVPTLIPLDSSVMHSEGLTSVADTVAVLAERAGNVARYGQHPEPQHLVGTNCGDGRSASPSALSVSFTGDGPLIAVPNIAATHRFKADHTLRSESKKPAVHRRAMRCVYCGGRHHVATCPTLRSQDRESDARHVGTASDTSPGSAPFPSSPHRSGRALFCIKCGQSGHLYTGCRQIPAGLHHATHCPICLQPRTSASHDPVHCPRRMSVPKGYRRNGIPEVEEGNTFYSASSHGSSNRPTLDSESDCSSPTTDRRLRQASTHVVDSSRRRRRRGSVLIADSFVD